MTARFSDRPESYRTEVLELLKTQIVKNAPVVPEGAKGAFVLRSGSIALADGYTIFIRGLLDATDNRVGGKPQPPPDTDRPARSDAPCRLTPATTPGSRCCHRWIGVR
jgi:glutamate dehydrogenase